MATDHYAKCDFRGTILIGKDAAKGIGRIYPKERVPPGQSYFTRCCNLPVQGSCADASMLAITYADERLFEAGIDGGPVAWLHDEIVLEVAVEDAERAAAILKQAMIDGFAETFPGAPLDGLVEPKIGMSWSEAKTGTIETSVSSHRALETSTGAIQAEAIADLRQGSSCSELQGSFWGDDLL